MNILRSNIPVASGNNIPTQYIYAVVHWRRMSCHVCPRPFPILISPGDSEPLVTPNRLDLNHLNPFIFRITPDVIETCYKML